MAEEQMKKAFQKGDQVTIINSWDRKGTVSFRHAVVYSCGAKQMVLTAEATNEEIGRLYAPEKGNQETRQGVFDRMTDDQAEQACLEAASREIKSQRERYERILQTTDHGPGYRKAIQRNLDALHEPRAIRFPE